MPLAPAGAVEGGVYTQGTAKSKGGSRPSAAANTGNVALGVNVEVQSGRLEVHRHLRVRPDMPDGRAGRRRLRVRRRLADEGYVLRHVAGVARIGCRRGWIGRRRLVRRRGRGRGFGGGRGGRLFG